MRAPSPQIKLINEPAPFGDMPLAPLALSGRSEAELARAMAEYSLAATSASTVTRLKALWPAFPHSLLTARLAALTTLVRR